MSQSEAALNPTEIKQAYDDFADEYDAYYSGDDIEKEGGRVRPR